MHTGMFRGHVVAFHRSFSGVFFALHQSLQNQFDHEEREEVSQSENYGLSDTSTDGCSAYTYVSSCDLVRFQRTCT